MFVKDMFASIDCDSGLGANRSAKPTAESARLISEPSTKNQPTAELVLKWCVGRVE